MHQTSDFSSDMISPMHLAHRLCPLSRGHGNHRRGMPALTSSVLAAGARLVGQIIEPAFNLLSVSLSELMTSVVAKLYRTFPPEAPDTPKIVRMRGRCPAHLPLQLPACALRVEKQAELRAGFLQYIEGEFKLARI